MQKRHKSIRLTTETIKRIEDIAEKNYRNFSAQLEVMLIDQMKFLESKPETIYSNPK